MHDAYKKNKIYYSFQRPKNCIFFLINDTVSKSVSETVRHRSDDAKLIDKLKSQMKIITFVM